MQSQPNVASGRRYDEVMPKPSGKPLTAKNGKTNGETSELGRVLQKIADKHAASGGKLLNRRELEREIAERRGLR
jgi:hypothetical protein